MALVILWFRTAKKLNVATIISSLGPTLRFTNERCFFQLKSACQLLVDFKSAAMMIKSNFQMCLALKIIPFAYRFSYHLSDSSVNSLYYDLHLSGTPTELK